MLDDYYPAGPAADARRARRMGMAAAVLLAWERDASDDELHQLLNGEPVEVVQGVLLLARGWGKRLHGPRYAEELAAVELAGQVADAIAPALDDQPEPAG